MKKLLLYLIILMHINTTMFIPIMNEVDTCDASGRPYDEINSVAEYIYQIILGHKDSTPEDEDSNHDKASYFNCIKGQHYIVHQFHIPIPTSQPLTTFSRAEHSLPVEPKILIMAYEVTVPPPDQA